MLNIVIFGAPGSGKGTQSERLAARYGLLHISTGEVLREHIARRTKLGIIADSYISKGQLIPDDLMIKVLASVLDNEPTAAQSGVIFDGFPRTIPQAKALKLMMEEHNSKVHAVIGLEVDENCLMQRMLLRGQQEGRADDNEETIKQRLAVYHQQTSPLREYYIAAGKYCGIDANGSIDDIFARIARAIDALPNLK